MDVYLLETEGNQSSEAHGLLREILKTNYGIEARVLSVGQFGKPYLQNGGPEFSISHTQGAVAVAVGDSPVGLDLERVRSFHQRVPQRIMSAGEYQWFVGRGEMKYDFFTLWTLKESYYKYLGTGLRGFPNETEFWTQGGVWQLRGQEKLVFWLREEKNLLMALCSHEQEKVNFHKL